MSEIAQELKSQIAVLSQEDRVELTVFLLDLLQGEEDQDWQTAWKEELRRREIDAKYVPAEEVFSKYRKSKP